MDKIDQDLRFLSLELPHRKTYSEEEQRAAAYICERLGDYVDMADIILAQGPSNFRHIMALYYAEFVVVGLVAGWWPRLAFFYGLFVFLAYILELFHFPVFSRFLPQSDTPVVVGARESIAPVCTIVFTAYLDSSSSYLDNFAFHTLSRVKLHLTTLMIVGILAACILSAWATQAGMVNYVATALRYVGMTVMAASSLLSLKNGLVAEPTTRGANHNASGIAALLHIAERLRKRPVKACNVLFLLPGGHYENKVGMKAAMAALGLSNDSIYIINVEGVGAGDLCYTVAEGALPMEMCDELLFDSAEKRQKRYHAQSVHAKHFLTNAYVPMSQGKKCISIIGLDENFLPVNHCEELDTYMKVDAEQVMQAARFAESIARATVKNLVERVEEE